MTHTKTPWGIAPTEHPLTHGAAVISFGDNDFTVADVRNHFAVAENCDANAAFIVRAVNAHDAMLAALVACHSLIASEFGSAEASALEGHPIDKAARATWDAVCEAIALAEGKP